MWHPVEAEPGPSMMEVVHLRTQNVLPYSGSDTFQPLQTTGWWERIKFLGNHTWMMLVCTRCQWDSRKPTTDLYQPMWISSNKGCMLLKCWLTQPSRPVQIDVCTTLGRTCEDMEACQVDSDTEESTLWIESDSWVARYCWGGERTSSRHRLYYYCY